MSDKNQTEFKTHVEDTGHAAEDAAGGTGDTARNFAGQVSEAVNRGREYARKARDQYPAVNHQIRDTSEPLIRTIKEQPVLCVAIAAGAGLLLGMLLTNSSSRRH